MTLPPQELTTMLETTLEQITQRENQDRAARATERALERTHYLDSLLAALQHDLARFHHLARLSDILTRTTDASTAYTTCIQSMQHLRHLDTQHIAQCLEPVTLDLLHIITYTAYARGQIGVYIHTTLMTIYHDALLHAHQNRPILDDIAACLQDPIMQELIHLYDGTWASLCADLETIIKTMPWCVPVPEQDDNNYGSPED